MFCLLMVVEAFSLQKVVKMLEEVVVFGEGPGGCGGSSKALPKAKFAPKNVMVTGGLQV